MKDRALKFGLFLMCIFVSASFYFKIELFRRGGPMMVPITLSSIFAFAIVLAKLRQFHRDGASPAGFLKDVFERIERDRIKEAIDLCEQADTPFSRILKEGIMKHDRPKDEIRDAMDNAFLYEAPLLEEHIPTLGAIVQIAPLLGFLGSLIGIIRVFLVVQARGIAFAPVVSADLAVGIWEALISACAGFLVAASTFIAHHYFTVRLRSKIEEMERGASELLDFLMERRMPV